MKILPAMQPLSQFPRADCRMVRAVLTDIDDTLTEHGRLPAVAYAALERLKAAGLIVVPVTGRPAGALNNCFSNIYRTYVRCQSRSGAFSRRNTITSRSGLGG